MKDTKKAPTTKPAKPSPKTPPKAAAKSADATTATAPSTTSTPKAKRPTGSTSRHTYRLTSATVPDDLTGHAKAIVEALHASKGPMPVSDIARAAKVEARAARVALRALRSMSPALVKLHEEK
jgi:hypothetical protein